MEEREREAEQRIENNIDSHIESQTDTHSKPKQTKRHERSRSNTQRMVSSIAVL